MWPADAEEAAGHGGSPDRVCLVQEEFPVVWGHGSPLEEKGPVEETLLPHPGGGPELEGVCLDVPDQGLHRRPVVPPYFRHYRLRPPPRAFAVRVQKHQNLRSRVIRAQNARFDQPLQILNRKKAMKVT